jgi:hypothetical protein
MIEIALLTAKPDSHESLINKQNPLVLGISSMAPWTPKAAHVTSNLKSWLGPLATFLFPPRHFFLAPLDRIRQYIGEVSRQTSRAIT